MNPSLELKFLGRADTETVLSEIRFSIDSQIAGTILNASDSAAQTGNSAVFIYKIGVQAFVELILETIKSDGQFVLSEENTTAARSLAEAFREAEKRQRKRRRLADSMTSPELKTWLENMISSPDDMFPRFRDYFHVHYCKKGSGQCWVRLSPRWFDDQDRLRRGSIQVSPKLAGPDIDEMIANLPYKRRKRMLSPAHQTCTAISSQDQHPCPLFSSDGNIVQDRRNSVRCLGGLLSIPTPVVVSSSHHGKLVSPVNLGDPNTRASVLHAAQVSTILGHIDDALKNYHALRDSCADGKERLYLTGQIINAGFIRLGSKEPNATDIWLPQNIREEVRDTLRVRSVDEFWVGDKTGAIEHIDKALGFAGWYALMWLIIAETEHATNAQDAERLLEKQIQVIRKIQESRPDIGWNRYTPLIAQALRLNQIEFAALAWREAHNCIVKGEAQKGGAIGNYALLHKESRSIEWTLHEALAVSIHIKMVNYPAAMKRVSEIRFEQRVDSPDYVVNALDTIREKARRLAHGKPFNPTCANLVQIEHHAKYFHI